MPKIKIHYYSDLLCVWAYIAQVRINELLENYNDQIDLDYHYTPTFASIENKVIKGWSAKGGVKAYAEHVKGLEKEFPHIKISDQCWTKKTPHSSINIHLFLRAMLEVDEITKKQFEDFSWQCRVDFFENAIDITHRDYQTALADKMNLPTDKIMKMIDSGAASAKLHADFTSIESDKIPGSPTLRFNNGRQVLYGNIGYKIIESSIKELLEGKHYDQSWC